MAEPVTSRRGAGLHTTPGDSLVAAINQLLGSDQPAPDQRDQSGPAPAANSASLSQVGDRAVAKDLPPASRQDRSEPALRIHIGEIVIAPEPGPPSTAERLAAPAWQPPVALAEYRAARARERR